MSYLLMWSCGSCCSAAVRSCSSSQAFQSGVCLVCHVPAETLSSRSGFILQPQTHMLDELVILIWGRVCVCVCVCVRVCVGACTAVRLSALALWHPGHLSRVWVYPTSFPQMSAEGFSPLRPSAGLRRYYSSILQQPLKTLFSTVYILHIQTQFTHRKCAGSYRLTDIS